MRDRMLRGQLYRVDEELAGELRRCALLVERYNATSATQESLREQLLRELLGSVGPGVVIRPPCYFDYGYQTTIGANTFINFGAVILDVGRVSIGANVQIGPNVQFLTPTHPLDAGQRRSGLEAAEPITVGDDVWLGGGVILCPGVSVGARSVIGAGSVVTRDVPGDVVAVGNPCRVVRQLGGPGR